MKEQNGLGSISPMVSFETNPYPHNTIKTISVKANANREQNLPSLLGQLCRDAALLIQRRKDGSCVSDISFNPSSSFPSFSLCLKRDYRKKGKIGLVYRTSS